MALPPPVGVQKQVVALAPSGHVVVLGTAGSGKTTMAIHRAALLNHACSNDDDRFDRSILSHWFGPWCMRRSRYLIKRLCSRRASRVGQTGERRRPGSMQGRVMLKSEASFETRGASARAAKREPASDPARTALCVACVIGRMQQCLLGRQHTDRRPKQYVLTYIGDVR
jgi:hypothetical protein